MTPPPRLWWVRRKLRALLTALFGLAVAVAVAAPASAHAPDEYGHNTYLTLGVDGVRIEIHLTPGPLVGAKLATIIDTNADGAFSDAETTRYGESIAADLVLTVDGQKRQIVQTSIVVPTPLDVRAGSDEIVWTGIAAGSAVRNEVQFEDHHQVLRGNAQASLLDNGNLPADLSMDRSIDRGIRITGTFIAQSAEAAAASKATPAASTNTSTKRTKRLQRYLGNANSLGAMAAALGIAALLGALHALTPGHGKTIAGAYLVGEHATVRHAIVLGGSVTITHTASVLALGAVSLGVAGHVDPATLTSGLRWVSGFLVLTIGLTLLVRRLRGGTHAHHDHHGHDYAPAHDHDGHGHDHADQVHNHGARPDDPKRPLGLRRLVALGASGGIIPCPEALGVLIVAVAVRRQMFGMAMIVAFSLGLASVLIAIGIALVRARRIVDRFGTIPEVVTARWLPVFSAAVVSLLGVAILSGRVV